ncbi:MAG: glycosyltransferase family A protein [bacterium]|nr:glycosyltransferase family A protein [bacterium]
MSMFTIVICCYNAESFLGKCFESIVVQNNPNFKVLFVDDASDDASLAIAERYSAGLHDCKIIHHAENKGLVFSCNEALAQIETPYFLRLDADDYLTCDAAESVIMELRKIGTRDFVVFPRWDEWKERKAAFEVGKDMYDWIAAGTLFKTEAVKLVGGYSNEHWEEYDLYLKLLQSGYDYKISPFRIYYYRRGEVSMTKDPEANARGVEQMINKWGYGVLNKYGRFEKINEYYNRISTIFA